METPNFSYYKNAEAVQFNDNVLSILKKNNPEALKVAPQLAAHSSVFVKMKQLYIIDQGSNITNELKKLDGLRDDALMGINLYVDSMLRHFQEDKRKAAERIQALLEKHGRDLYRRSYAEQTAGVRSICEEIEAVPELNQAVAEVRLGEWFTELNRLNDLFDKTYLERNEAYAKAPKEKFSDLRKETETAYETLMTHLSAHALINPGKKYDQVLEQIAQLVLDYNQTVGNRIGSGSDLVTE